MITKKTALPFSSTSATATATAKTAPAPSVVDLAPMARLGPHYFSRAFKRTLGETPHAYVSRRRIEQALHLMLSTDSPLAQIALACGFADQSHFTNRFRRLMGVTPTVWRRGNRA